MLGGPPLDASRVSVIPPGQQQSMSDFPIYRPLCTQIYHQEIITTDINGKLTQKGKGESCLNDNSFIECGCVWNGLTFFKVWIKHSAATELKHWFKGMKVVYDLGNLCVNKMDTCVFFAFVLILLTALCDAHKKTWFVCFSTTVCLHMWGSFHLFPFIASFFTPLLLLSIFPSVLKMHEAMQGKDGTTKGQR